MIVPLSSAVDDEVYRAVLSICGEEVALKLCYEDPAEIAELKQVIAIILNGFPMGGRT